MARLWLLLVGYFRIKTSLVGFKARNFDVVEGYDNVVYLLLLWHNVFSNPQKIIPPFLSPFNHIPT